MKRTSTGLADGRRLSYFDRDDTAVRDEGGQRDVLRRFDHLFDEPAPYVSAVHQAPVGFGRDLFALHVEVFATRRASGPLKYLAGSETGMDAFANDIPPEVAAERLRAAS